jgi:hypothetical protein
MISAAFVSTAERHFGFLELFAFLYHPAIERLRGPRILPVEL